MYDSFCFSICWACKLFLFLLCYTIFCRFFLLLIIRTFIQNIRNHSTESQRLCGGCILSHIKHIHISHPSKAKHSLNFVQMCKNHAVLSTQPIPPFEVFNTNFHLHSHQLNEKQQMQMHCYGFSGIHCQWHTYWTTQTSYKKVRWQKNVNQTSW